MPQMMDAPFRHILILAMLNLMLQENYIKQTQVEVEEAILTTSEGPGQCCNADNSCQKHNILKTLKCDQMWSGV